MGKEYRHIGKNATRFDAPEIVSGEAIFLDDFKMKDCLWAKALRSPHAHARITKIDISKAEALKGVHCVLYYGNLPDEVKKWGLNMPPVSPILRPVVSFVGDAVAIVAADTIQIAEEACDLIEVEYEVLPAVFNVKDASQPDAPRVHEEFPSNFLPNVRFIGEDPLMHLVRGDVEQAFAECDYVVEGSNDYDALGCPMAMEPPAVIMKYEKGRLKTWATTQNTMMYTGNLGGRLCGQPVDNTVFNLGGGFGNKSELAVISLETAALAYATGKAVRMSMTKTEQLLIHDQRIGMNFTGKVGIKDGIIHAVQGVVLLDCGAFNSVGQLQIGVGLGESQIALGKCKNWDVEGKLVMTNHVQTGPVRGFGGLEVKATMMPLVTKAAEMSGMDPVEFLKKNFAQTGDEWIWRNSFHYTCREQDYSPTIEATAEKFKWKEKWKGWNTPTWTDGHKARGVGVSLHGNADVGEEVSEAYVRFVPATGYAYLHLALCETGTGQRSNMRKFAAEVLDMPIEKVIVTPANSEVNPYEAGPVGSRGTITMGTAVTRAAEDCRRKVLEAVAPKLHVSPEELSMRDGMVYFIDQPDKVYHPADFLPISATVSGFGRYTEDYTTSNFNIFFTEVEVDLDTGEVKQLDVCMGTDAGQIIDPASLELQLQGCFGAAMSDSGLLDENVLDTSTGRVLTGNMYDYKWRTFNDFPTFDATILESQPNVSRYKAIGAGEISGNSGPAAIMMAISNAIGKDFVHYPATPQSILKALGKL